jgi:hypothetical protein
VFKEAQIGGSHNQLKKSVQSGLSGSVLCLQLQSPEFSPNAATKFEISDTSLSILLKERLQYPMISSKNLMMKLMSHDLKICRRYRLDFWCNLSYHHHHSQCCPLFLAESRA